MKIKNQINSMESRKISYIFLALIFLLPLQNIHLGKLPSLGGGLNALNMLVLISLLISMSLGHTKFYSDYNKYLYLFILSYIVSFFYAPVYMGTSDPESLFRLKDLLIPFFLFFITYKFCANIYQIKRIFYVTALPLPYMFKVYYTNLSWMGFGHYSDKLRLNGGTFMMLGSNEINAFYATYTFVLFSVALSENNKLIKGGLMLAVAMNTYCIIYGFSRGAYVSFLAGMVVWAIVSSHTAKLIFALIGVMFIGFVGVKILPTATVERFTMSFSQDEERDESAQSRIEFWELAFEKYMENPLTGIGYRNFPKVNPAGLDTHNYYVKVMVENGILGVLALFLLLRASWSRICHLKRIAKDPFLVSLAIGMIPCFIAMLIGNMFGDRFTHYPLISYFYIYMALVMRGIAISEQEGSAIVAR